MRTRGLTNSLVSNGFKEKDTHLFPRMSFNSAPPSQVLELKMYTTFGSPVGFVGICTALFVMTSLWEDETFELVITPRFDECRRVVWIVKEEDEFFLEDKEEEDFCWCCTNTCCEADKDEDIIVIQVFAKERVFTTALCVRARVRLCEFEWRNFLSFLCFFFANATETSRGATKKHLRASVSKRHVKIFLTREKKKKRKRRDEFDHDTSKKVKQQEFYIQKYRKGWYKRTYDFGWLWCDRYCYSRDDHRCFARV